MVDQAAARFIGRSGDERVPGWYRPRIRTAMLEAARKLIADEGLEGASLRRVAEITGFTPAIVYAYFVNRADLATAIVAEDIASYARTIIDFPFTKTEHSPSYHSAVEDWASPLVEHPLGRRDLGLAPSAGPEDGDQADGAAGMAMFRSEKKFDLRTALAAPAESQDEVAAARESDGDEYPADANVLRFSSAQQPGTDTRIPDVAAPAVDPSLELRLTKFELALGALEMRVAELVSEYAKSRDARSSADAAAAFRDDEMHRLENRVEQLETRLVTAQKQFADDFEVQAKSIEAKLDAQGLSQSQNSSELKTLLDAISGRLADFERNRHASMNAAEVATITNDAQRSPSNDSYISTAKHAVSAALSLAQSDGSAPVRRVTLAGFSFAIEPSRALLAMTIGLGVAVAGTGLLLKDRAQTSHAVAAAFDQFRSPPIASSARMGRAQSAAGLAYLNGEGVAKNSQQAARLLSSAAASGEPVAEYWLATLYEHGNGVVINKQQANRLYLASATQGNLRAMYKLAVSYAEGWGAPQNYPEAARWFSYAAQRGAVNAQYNLGVLYERGLGVPQSLLDAYKWYALAAAQGDKVSAERIDVLSSQMGADDLAVARQAVADFKPQERNPAANWTPGSSAMLGKPRSSSPKT